MAATKAPPLTVLENFHKVSEAAIRLGLRKKDEPGKKGEKWLRDGVNLHGFPHHRLAGQLMFSDSDLAEIAARNANAGTARGRRKVVRRRPANRTSPAAA